MSGRGVAPSVIRFREHAEAAVAALASIRPEAQHSAYRCFSSALSRSAGPRVDGGAARAQAEAGPALREGASRRLFSECRSTVLPITADGLIG